MPYNQTNNSLIVGGSMDKLVYLGENILQQDMRFRLPKSILVNLNVEAGRSVFEIYLNVETEEIILKRLKNEGE